MDPCSFVSGDIVQLRYLECVFGNLVSVIIPFAGILLFVLVIIAGFKFITAGADPNKAAAATKTFTALVGGFVLLALAYLILKLIEDFTGVPITVFKVFQP